MESKQFTLNLGGYQMPIDIHHLGVEENGHEAGTRRDHFRFNFQWRMLKFHVAYHEEGGAVLDLTADLGGFPFTAESPKGRTDLKAILGEANSRLGPVFQIRNGRITVIKQLPVQLPVTAVELVTALTGFLLKLAPYLDCLSMILATPIEVSKGASRLRPAYRRPVTTKGARRI